MTDQAIPPSIQLSRMISSLWIPQAIHAAAALGVADALGDAARPSAAVATAIAAHPGATHRLLRALVALGLCTQADDGNFALTPLGACLRSDAPDSVRSWALLMGGRMVWDSWARLSDCVRTGECAPQLIAGQNAFEWIAAHPDEFAVFDRSMQELTTRLSGLVAASYDFSAAHTVVDVGGGHGALLPAILAANPALHGVVFDQPHCGAGAAALAERAGTAARTRFVGGDFFRAVPEGGDVYLLKSVIHDWDDERSLAILRACRAALQGAARLVIVEIVVPATPGSSPLDQLIASTDLNMLVATGGCERTEAQYRALCDAAGLAISRILPTPSPFSLIETRPAQ
ncbi:MAG: methyltransferase [Deltaproteobacteria bacterium]|nr:methyltransferase [Deltaproteobacteria bacterium]